MPGFIGQAEYRTARATPLVLAPFKIREKKTGFFIEHTKQALDDYLPGQEEVLTKGLTVRTTINLRMTDYAYSAIEKGMKLYQDAAP